MKSIQEHPGMEMVTLRLKQLTQKAVLLGASEARLIPSDAISVREDLAKFCVEPRCEHYGQAPGCPPHVSGPAGFRDLQKMTRYAIVVRIVTPASALLSEESRNIWRTLHGIVVGVEHAAVEMGYSASRAFAGGSCKAIFCHDDADCVLLSGKGECRHSQKARPSMSGFGVDVSTLMKTCGWPADFITHGWDASMERITWVAGLIMIG